MMLPLLIGCAAEPTVPAGHLAIALPLAEHRPATSTGRPLRATFVLPDGIDAERVVLRAERTGWRLSATIGGRTVASDVGGIRPMALDLTGHVRAGPNVVDLVLEPARPDNVVLGQTIAQPAAWVYGEPRRGEIALGALTLDVGAARRVDDVDVWMDGDLLRARARVTGAEGRRVSFAVRRDEALVASLPSALVRDGVAETAAMWRGPRWRGPGGVTLLHLVATLPTGEVAAVRFGARALGRDGARLTLDGEPTYLAAHRVDVARAEPRAALAAIGARWASVGLNAVEVHGTLFGRTFLDAADELGIPVILTPRCDGRRQKDGPHTPDAAWAAFVDDGDRRIVEDARDHPSVFLWNLEAMTYREFPTLHAPMRDAGAPLVDDRESLGYNIDTYARMRREKPLPPSVNELSYAGGANRALAWFSGLLEEHRHFGLGVVAPHTQAVLEPRGDPTALATLADLLARADVPQLPTGPRRGPATIAARAQPGAVVYAWAPGLAPVGAVADATGIATLNVDFDGVARVGVWGGAETTARLTPGTYAAGVWTPSVTKVGLQ